MAHVVKARPMPSITQRHLFPWDEWLNGHTWVLTRGEDFHSRPEYMMERVRSYANRAGFDVEVTRKGDEITLRRI